MLSKLIKLLRKLIAEVSGGLVLMAMVVGIFLAATLNEGAMRIIAPLLVLVVGLVVYGLTWLIAEKPDRR
jgi:glycerol uptake facilitator-like aquaporin